MVVAALKDDMAMTDLSMNPEGSSGDGNGGVPAMAGRVQMSLYGLDGAPIVAAWNAKELPSRGLTYPTLGKGKSSSKCHFWGIC